MKLDTWQKDFLACKGDKQLCTGRQVGKTEICAIDCHDWAMKTSKKGIILMTAPQEFQAEVLFSKTLDYFQKKSPNEIKGGAFRPTKKKITLKKGITIICKTAGVTGFGLRGITVIRKYIDECAQMTDMSWDSIDPNDLVTGGDTIYLSTPFGMQGRFYECWINKDDAYNSFTRFSIDSETCVKEREICKTWTKEIREKAIKKIERARARMTAKRFMQEYMGEFIEDLMQFFPDKLVKGRQTAEKENYNSKYNYYLGVDVGGKGGDESTFEILRKSTKGYLIQVENMVEDYKLTTDTERQILHLDTKFRFKKIYIDASGIGAGIFDHLLENPQTRRKIIPIENASKSLDRDGRKKKLLKEDLYNNLLCMMERGEITLLKDPNIAQSLKSVQFEITEEKNIRIFGNYTHIAEGLIRAAWGIKDKINKVWIR